jgi:hypothetical protein
MRCHGAGRRYLKNQASLGLISVPIGMGDDAAITSKEMPHQTLAEDYPVQFTSFPVVIGICARDDPEV